MKNIRAPLTIEEIQLIQLARHTIDEVPTPEPLAGVCRTLERLIVDDRTLHLKRNVEQVAGSTSEFARRRVAHTILQVRITMTCLKEEHRLFTRVAEFSRECRSRGACAHDDDVKRVRAQIVRWTTVTMPLA